MVERKAFLEKPKHQIVYPNEYDMENGGKKNFCANPKHQDGVPQSGEHDCSANDKKNWNY